VAARVDRTVFRSTSLVIHPPTGGSTMRFMVMHYSDEATEADTPPAPK
jgi:hypothetical protein